ncbi:MAG: S41 family peptidase [Planctomycetes bacterium]|nr:S41 family peptidase [Planctomycetota bacterium]
MSARLDLALGLGLGLLLTLAHQGSLNRVWVAAGAQDLAMVAEARELIVERWVEEPDSAELRDAAVAGMANSLDPFSRYIPPEQLRAFNEQTSGQFGGLGVLIEVFEGRLRVLTPFKGTPAWEARLLPGDVIAAVDGEPLEGLTRTEDAAGKLKGAPGSEIRLTVERPGVEGPLEFTLTRARIDRESVRRERILADGIGYLFVEGFNAATAIQCAEALRRLEGEGLRALILDLRDNGGGYVDAAVDLADLFLPAETLVVTTRGRGGVVADERRTSTAPLASVPVAVLINAHSASASEILAGALTDCGVATAVGTRSYGKGSVQTLLFLLGGTAKLKLTTHYFYTPKGRRIHQGRLPDDDPSWGVLPSIRVPISDEVRGEVLLAESAWELKRLQAEAFEKPFEAEEHLHEHDPQVAAAFAHLQRVLSEQAELGEVLDLTPPSVADVDSGD